MRKTRLVILPTKCLHQMGFLLLFLSCPVIGDWGRIRPESENSHNAIQIQREGTCGFERDPPGGLLDFLNETGSKQCRLSEEPDLNKPISVRRFDERRVVARRINQRESERRLTERRDVRSRSVEPRRINNRNIRSLSLSRIESERSARRYSEERRETERLHMSRVEQQRRINRERESRRLTRSTERERRDVRRENDQQRERRENIRERSERRLSLARREIQTSDKERRNIRAVERRLPEIRKARSMESIPREATDRRREDTRRFVTLSPKISDRNIRERRLDSRTRRMNIAETRELNLDRKNDNLEVVSDWTNFNYDSFKTGDWTTNCVIGAVVYYFTTRQIKTA